MQIETKAPLATREGILKLLSDEDLERVSVAEMRPRLATGDEYLDLEHLEKGVQRAPGASSVPMGRVLSRRVVHDEAWGRIVKQLAWRAARERGPLTPALSP
jgi:hypothetical protein